MEEMGFFSAMLGTLGLYIYWALYVVTSVACAFFVYQDAIKQPRLELKISPYWWATFSLIGGVWTALVYWLMQHSTLSKSKE
jgi:hypothetical protein